MPRPTAACPSRACRSADPIRRHITREGQPLDRGGHPLVRRRERDAYEAVTGRPVEVARCHQNAELRQVRHGLPARLVARRPQVEARLAVLDPEAMGLQRPAQGRAPVCVPGPLLGDVRVVAERRDGRRLDGGRRHHSAVLADQQQLAEHGRVARDEGRAVSGQVGALGERVDGDDALVRTAADVRMQYGDGLGLPAQLQVALVTEDQHVVLARPGDDPDQFVLGQDATGRVGRRVEPEQLQAGRVQLRRIVVDDGLGAAEAGAHLVRRVGEARVRHLVARAETELRRQPGHQLLGPDDRQDVLVRHPGRAEPPLHPAGDRVTQLGGPPHRRIAGAVRGGDERPLDQLGHRVDGRADGQVHDAVRVDGGRRLVGRELVPGEDREAGGDCGHGSLLSRTGVPRVARGARAWKRLGPAR